MTDIDPAEMMRRHAPITDGPFKGWCAACPTNQTLRPCLPYRLADALAVALDELDRIATHTAEAFAQRDAAQAKVARVEALARVSGGTSGRPPTNVRAADIRAALADG